MEAIFGIFGALTIIIIIAIFWMIGVYNSLIKLRNYFKNAYSQIDVQFKRRHNLIPNLIEVAKQYMSHEIDTFEAVINARNNVAKMSQQVAADPTDPQSMKSLISAESTLGGAMGNFFALSEDYPDLKANEQMEQLHEELVSTENKVAFARQAFNDAVTQYNNAREIFPNSIVASIGNFQVAELFVVTDSQVKEAVKVEF